MDKFSIDTNIHYAIMRAYKVVCMFKKSTSTSRICDDRSTPIQWNSTLFFGGLYVNPPKRSKPIVYSTKSHSRREILRYMIGLITLRLKSYGLN